MAAKRGIDWDSQPLGKVTDAELARRLGVHETVVAGARTRRYIQSHRKSRGATIPDSALHPASGEADAFASVSRLADYRAWRFAMAHGAVHYLDDLRSEAALHALVAVREHSASDGSIPLQSFVATRVWHELHSWLRRYGRGGLPTVKQLDIYEHGPHGPHGPRGICESQHADPERSAERAEACRDFDAAAMALQDDRRNALFDVLRAEASHVEAGRLRGCSNQEHNRRYRRALDDMRRSPAVRRHLEAAQ